MGRLRMFLKTHTAVIASGTKQSLLEKKIASSPEPALSPVEGAPRNDVFLSHAIRLWRISAAVLTSIVLLPTLALAHGGMGPDEIGPPIMTSGLIGFVSYWVVMLWPSAKKKADQTVGVNGQDLYVPRTGRRPKKRSARVKRVPRLRKIEGSGQFDSAQHPRRKASDG
jgi:hypothetical protein